MEVRAEGENWKPQLAAAGGRPTPFATRKVWGLGRTNRPGHLAKPRWPTICREEKRDIRTQTRPSRALSAPQLETNKVPGGRGAGVTLSLLCPSSCPLVRTKEFVGGWFAGIKPGRIPSTFILGSAKLMECAQPQHLYRVMRPDNSAACPWDSVIA